MNLPLALLVLWLLAAVMMAAGWRWQRRHDNTGIVDVLWATGLGAGAVGLAICGGGAAAPRVLLALCGGLWGARLALHLWARVRSEPEDGRYRNLRARWKGGQGKLFAFFQFQALLIVLCALPFAAVARNPLQLSGWLLSGGVIWLASVIGEGVADRQLARFRADPVNRGTTCRTGLWRVSRHPNYFCEWLHWFAYVCFAVGSPLEWLAWLGPLLMFLFLRFLTGIPWTEAQALRTRGEDYRAYQRSTPMFFPWFPRRSCAARSQST
jgi:steroid 5-alpha reductase family enzyme